MGFFHRHKFIEFVTDPSSGRFSMSRFLLPWVLLLDAAWVLAVCKGIPPALSYVPVSSMLAIITGAICGIYALNSFGGSIGGVIARWKGGGEAMGLPPGYTPPPAKPPGGGP